MKLLTPFLALAVLAGAALAQNTNENAPTATNALAFDDAKKVELSYRSFTIAGGAWLAGLYDTGPRGERTRKFYNEQYITDYLRGSMTVVGDLDLDGNPLQAGTYRFTFRIDEDLVWHLVVMDEKGKNEICAVAMATERDDKNTASRLSIAPVAAAKGDEGHLAVHFGPLRAKIAFKVSKAKAAPAKVKKAG